MALQESVLKKLTLLWGVGSTSEWRCEVPIRDETNMWGGRTWIGDNVTESYVSSSAATLRVHPLATALLYMHATLTLSPSALSLVGGCSPKGTIGGLNVCRLLTRVTPPAHERPTAINHDESCFDPEKDAKTLPPKRPSSSVLLELLTCGSCLEVLHPSLWGQPSAFTI